jgi:hypothetical protein
MECAERIGRVGRPFARDLQVVDLEALVVADRQAAQRQPRLRARVAGDLLVRRVGVRDQQDALEAELVVGLLGGEQVGLVGRVERAAEDPEAARRGASLSGRVPLPARRT